MILWWPMRIQEIDISIVLLLLEVQSTLCLEVFHLHLPVEPGIRKDLGHHHSMIEAFLTNTCA